METIICSRCEASIQRSENQISTGYAIYEDKKICYQCAGEIDAIYMRQNDKVAMYLSGSPDKGYAVINWPGTLQIPVSRVKQGRHNMAGTRTDVWFNFHGWWHGVKYGRNTEVIYCKRIKS